MNMTSSDLKATLDGVTVPQQILFIANCTLRKEIQRVLLESHVWILETFKLEWIKQLVQSNIATLTHQWYHHKQQADYCWVRLIQRIQLGIDISTEDSKFLICFEIHVTAQYPVSIVSSPKVLVLRLNQWLSP